MSFADHGIFKNLRSATCVCGAAKSPGKSFCRRDYFRLPEGLRVALYERDGYPDTFRRCCLQLELKAPEGPKTINEVFPPRLVSRPINQGPRRRFRR